MAQGGIGMGNGIGRFGVTGPVNAVAPGGGNRVSTSDTGDVKWYASGPFWTLVFLLVGYILVYKTLR